MSEALVVRALQASYDAVPVLRGVDLRVGAAEFVVLTGRNGSGKSTLFRCLTGMHGLGSGEVLWWGKPGLGNPVRMKEAGVLAIPQGGRVFSELTVREHFRLPKGGPKEIDTIVSFFPELKRNWDKHAGALSGGERHLLSVTWSLGSARFLLADEPGAGLAEDARLRVMELLKLLQTERQFGGLVLDSDGRKFSGLTGNRLLLTDGRVEVRPAS